MLQRLCELKIKGNMMKITGLAGKKNWKKKNHWEMEENRTQQLNSTILSGETYAGYEPSMG